MVSTYDFSNPDFAGWLQENIAADEIHLVGTIQRSQLKPLDACFAQLQGKLVDISKLSIALPDWARKDTYPYWEVFFADLEMDSDLSEHFFEKLYINSDYSTRFIFYKDYVLSEDGTCFAAFLDSPTAIIPNGVTYIGIGAFASSTKMASVQFPESVTKIGHISFAYVSNLRTIVLPPSLRELSSFSFFMCDDLKSVFIPEGIVEIPFECFRYCDIEEISFPSSLRAIREDAFHAGMTMDYLALPEGLEILESGAFATAVEMIHLPSTLKECAEDWYYDYIVGKKNSYVKVC